MPLPKLITGTLIRRYKRFIADVRLRNGHTVSAHCPNSGSMLTCSEPGRPVFLSRAANPNRRLKYTWELIDMPGSMVGVNTQAPNRLVEAAALTGAIESLAGYELVRREINYGHSSRIDLLLEDKIKGSCFVEVKNCTFVENGIASFPDAVTTRGRKHLFELRDMVRSGYRGVIFFLIQRTDAKLFRPADRIDPAYGQALREVCSDGVEIMAYDVLIDMNAITLNAPIPREL